MPRARNTPKAPDLSADSPVRSVAFVSLGCPKNLVDSEKMLGLLAEDGLLPVSAEAEGEADAIVVNTCGFLEASKEESLEVIRDAVRRKEAGEIKRVVVAGCLVQRHRAKMLEWVPGIDAMIGVFDRDHIVDAVRGPTLVERKALREVSDNPRYWIAGNALQAAKARGMNTVGLTVNGKDGAGLGYFESDASRLRLTPRHYAYLRISEGCNQNCAFCTIPSIRGKMRSKPLDAILAEARELLRDGAVELNLIGQDTTSYGDDIGAGFARASGAVDFESMGGLPRLLSALNAVVDEERGAAGGWLRLMYAYPTNFADEMVAAIADLPHVLKYIDIPLQHASDAVLERMRRNVTAEAQRRRIASLRDRAPGMAIRTTFITGFPGETEDDHKRLLGFIAETRFDMLGVFEYSREEGTPAGTMDADPALAVPPEVKARRRDEIMSLQQSIAFERNRAVAARFDPDRPSTTGARYPVLIDANVSAPKKQTGRRRSADAPAHSSQGRAYFQAPQIDSATYVHSRGPLEPGAMVECTVVGADGYDLIAVPSADIA